MATYGLRNSQNILKILIMNTENCQNNFFIFPDSFLKTTRNFNFTLNFNPQSTN